MQKKNTILILGLLSITIMVAAQYIILRRGWKQVDEMLYLRYRSLSQEAVASVRGSRMAVWDTVRMILDYTAYQNVTEIMSLTDSSAITKKKTEIKEFFNAAINKEEDLSSYISDFLENQGAVKEFNKRVEITNLQLIDNDTIIIFRDPSFRDRRLPPDREGFASSLKGSISTIRVVRQGLIGNNFLLSFDFYIDFSFGRSMILRELSASLGMSVFSTLTVLLIFLITFRNLMEEKRLSNLKTDFINNMTHELKTPLATITVAGKTLELERVRSDDAKILETAKLIGKQSVHLNQLINMILEISMWERTEFQLDKKRVDFEEIMHEIVFSFRSGGGNGAEISESYNFGDARPEIDIVYFTTMINNLLSNAVKYCDKPPVISIEGSNDGKTISVNIADNGIGISKSDQKHVFDKFYRASSGNIHKYKGLGLGLYYVKKIATAHGGDVTLTSKPGKGSIFTVIIPL